MNNSAFIRAVISVSSASTLFEAVRSGFTRIGNADLRGKIIVQPSHNNKMAFGKVLKELNIFSQCQKMNLSLWQCPQFLFLVMGIIICVTSVASYLIGTRYIADPGLVALIVLLVTAILFIIAFLIVRSFERLAEANRMKSEFVSIVSHQFRSPLSNLGWVLELLMSGKLGSIEEQQTEYFQILKENVSRMKDLASDLIIVSRIETANLPQKKEKFFPDKLAQKLIGELEPFARASNVKLKLEIEKKLPQVYADPRQIIQVLQNLIDNAIRYIKGGGTVSIKIKRKAKEVYFEIQDTGVGIPKEEQKYIFQKFFRSKNVLHQQTQGSGLGLFIARSIIERSQGKIGFQSEEGKGSRFWFSLPIK